MDLLATLKTFVAVTETGSFSAVARHENSSQSAVTRRIADLEAHFGVRLFHRTTRRLSLAPDGEELLAHARQVIAASMEMEDALGSHRTAPVGLVRLGAPVGFGNYVASHLPDLLTRHPGLSVELILADAMTDMIEARLDIAIRARLQEDSALIVRQIAEVGWVVAASPEYLKAHGTPERPEDLLEHECLLHISARSGVWRFIGPDGPMEVPVRGRLSVNVLGAAHRAALAGAGIAMLPDLEIADDIRSGRLVRLLGEYQAPRMPLYIATLSRRFQPPRTRVVMDFLIDLARRGFGTAARAAAAKA
jgi:DNA-binding transcriptional LysR family regulator